MISGYVYTQEGVGMSSSKGTGVSPEEIIEERGADCLRYWAAGAGTGEDIIYEEKDVVRGRKILRKIWNASRFVGMHLDDYEGGEVELETIDKWILTRLNDVVEDCEEHYGNYEVSKVRRKMENFFKNVFCDNYLEIVKHRLYEIEEYGEESRQAALKTLYKGLISCLKVFMPIIPHITEEIYQKLFREREGVESINLTDWPSISEHYLDEESEELGQLAKDIIAEIRRWKSDQGIPLNEDLPSVRFGVDRETEERVTRVEGVIKGAINIDEITYEENADPGDGIKVQDQPVVIKDIQTP